LTNSTDDIRYRKLLRLLRAGRKTAGIPQADLAKQIRKSQQFISKYESGERRLDAIEFADICYALGLDPGDLLLEAAPHLGAKGRKLRKP
jgi:transcriptional regulator with XRE-family HTH domain